MQRDIDMADRMFRLHAFAWAAFPGVIGAVGGALIAVGRGAGFGGVLLGVVLGFLLVAGVIGGVALLIAERSGRVGASVYFTAGSSTPAKRDYSLAEALLARGQYDPAARELERCAAAWPDDPEPCARLARMYRDRLARPDEAAVWLRRAVAASATDRARETLLMHELDELHAGSFQMPRRVLPDLARFAARHAGAPAGTWARARIAEIKRDLNAATEDGHADT